MVNSLNGIKATGIAKTIFFLKPIEELSMFGAQLPLNIRKNMSEGIGYVKSIHINIIAMVD